MYQHLKNYVSEKTINDYVVFCTLEHDGLYYTDTKTVHGLTKVGIGENEEASYNNWKIKNIR